MKLTTALWQFCGDKTVFSFVAERIAATPGEYYPGVANVAVAKEVATPL